MKAKAEINHDDHTRRIWHRPAIIGLEGILLSARESNLLHSDGSIYHQPDNLCFDPSAGILYNIEYKGSNNSYKKAYKQLTEQERELRDIFSVPFRVVSLYVHDNYVVEMIK